MTWPTERERAGRRPAKQAGFTLLEMVIVLAVLGLMAGLILYRGPPHSPVLDLRAASDDVVRTLRLARAEAISSNRRVAVVFDLTRRDITVAGAATRPLPAALGLAVAGTATAAHELDISFAADGSSSGGQVDVSEGEQRQRIDVDWLTGRVSVVTP